MEWKQQDGGGFREENRNAQHSRFLQREQVFSTLIGGFKLTGEALAREERGLQLCVYVCVVVVGRG